MAPRSPRRRPQRRHSRREITDSSCREDWSPGAGPVVGTTDQVRPQDGERSHKAQRARARLAGRSLSDPIRWRPSRRPRTEERNRRQDEAHRFAEAARGASDVARLPPGWRGTEPPSTTLCAGCAGGLAAIVDRGSVPRRIKLQAGTRKRARQPNQKTEWTKK